MVTPMTGERIETGLAAWARDLGPIAPGLRHRNSWPCPDNALSPRTSAAQPTLKIAMTHSISRTTALAAAIALTTSLARADVVFADNFDSPAYGHGAVSHNYSERWVNTDYRTASSGTGGWNFQGDVLYVQDAATKNGAIVLNERGAVNSAAHVLSGLNAGQTYALSFLLSGDNRVGQNYGLYAWIDAVLVFAGGATDGAPGSSAGTLEQVLFTAPASTATLKFSEYTFTGSQASPVIDDVSVTVPEPASWALVCLSLLGLVATRHRKPR